MQYFCSHCGEPVGQSQNPILEEGATVFCAKCSKLSQVPMLNDNLTSVYGTDAFDRQMASELEGSFLLLNKES